MNYSKAFFNQKILKKIQDKYDQHQIKHAPYVVIKADAGTYGMGIMIAKSPEDVLSLNRKKRNKRFLIILKCIILSL